MKFPNMASLRSRGIPALVVAMLVIGLLGWWMAYDIRSDSAADNHAVVDATATAAVQTQVSKALTMVLSYDYGDPGSTEKAADALLAGDARKEYETLFASLQERAPDQKLVLTAQVEASGVKKLTDDSAELLVFLDQSSRRAGDKEASVSAAQLAVTATKADGTWKITELKPL